MIKWKFSQPDYGQGGKLKAEEHIKLQKKGKESMYKKPQGRTWRFIVLKGLKTCLERRQPAQPDGGMACDGQYW